MKRRKKFYILLSILYIIISFISLMFLRETLTEDATHIATKIESQMKADYIYIDQNYNLKSYNKLEDYYEIIDSDVTEFKSSSKIVAYIKDTLDGKFLYTLNLDTNEVKDFGFIGNNDYIPYEEYVLFVENSSIIAMDTNTNKKSTILNVKTNDVILEDINGSALLFTRRNESSNETLTYLFESKSLNFVGDGLSSNHFSKEDIWGITSEGNIYRFKNNAISTIPNLEIIKLKVVGESVYYINANGELCLFTNGNEKKLALNVLDFVASEDIVHYISHTSNTINELRKNSSSKASLFEDALNSVYVYKF